MDYEDNFDGSSGAYGSSFDEERPSKRRGRSRSAGRSGRSVGRRNDNFMDTSHDGLGDHPKKSGNMVVNVILIIIILFLLVAILFCILYLTKAWRPTFMKKIFGANNSEGWKCVGNACDASPEPNDTQACYDKVSGDTSACVTEFYDPEDEEEKRRRKAQGFA